MSEALVHYDLNPVYFRDQPAYYQLKPMHRLFFRELMDLVWLSESKFRIDYKPAELAEQMGFEEAEVEEAIDTLSADSCGLIDLIYLLDPPGYVVQCPYLEAIKKKMLGRMEQANSVSLASDIKKSNTLSSVQRVMGGEANMEPTVGYLDGQEIARDSALYSNWLPTALFAQGGQVFYIRGLLKESLMKRFPDRDLSSDFEDMFRYLMDNPDRRPYYGVMNRFIARWLTRNVAKSSSPETPADDESIDDAFEKLLTEEID